MNFEQFVQGVLKGKIDSNVAPFGYQFMRLTQSRVALVAWDSEKKEKTQISIISEKKKNGEIPWELTLPDYKWISVLST